jgi:hypothetical protein
MPDKSLENIAVEGQNEREAIPLDGNGKLPCARARLDDNVGLLYTRFQKLGLCAGDEGLDDGGVPAGVDDADAQVGAIVVLRSRTLERGHDGWVVEKKMLNEYFNLE